MKPNAALEPQKQTGSAISTGGVVEPAGRGSVERIASTSGGSAGRGATGVADRRGEAVVDRRNGLERRRGPGRRRSDDRRSAEEGELSEEQFEFVMAMDEYKRMNKRPFPSWTEVLEVIKYLGYRKVAPKGEHLDRPAAHEAG